MSKATLKRITLAATVYLFIIFIIIIIEAILIITQSYGVAQQPDTPAPKATPVSTTQGTPTVPPAPTPKETPYPKPTYVPTLRPYDIDKSHDIWHAKDPSSYIEPNNEWVKYYASQLFIDLDRRIKYKNEKIEWWMDLDGVKHYTNKPFINNYVYDWEQFGTGSQGSLANDDYWTNADYYLTHGMKGDCDDWMIAVTSMMLSGEISVWEGDILVKKIVPAKAVMGYMENKKDGWVEYQVYNMKFITSTAREVEAITGNKISQTWYLSETNELFRLYKPVFEFTDKYFKVVGQ